MNQDMSCIPLPEKDTSQGGLNAALLIFEPNKTVYQGLLDMLNNGNTWEDSDQVISYWNLP
jgi:hypothetical protein